MRILIIGGGIGGLTAAVALRRAGFDAHVYEQMRELGEVGAGLVLGPNAVRVLDGLGFGAAVQAVGLVSRVSEQRHWQTGAVLERTLDSGEAQRQRYGYPSYYCHRAEIHGVVRAGVDDTHVTLNARCIAIEQDEQTVTAHFADGTSAAGDMLVGADGAGSVVRDYVSGPNSSVHPSKVAWRGLAPGAVGHALGMEPSGCSFRGQGKIFLAYYVANERFVNWIGIMNPTEALPARGAFTPGEQSAALADFAGWAEPVRTLIASTTPVAKWVLYDGDPLPAWTRGRVTLLGDAAHPMLPFAAQGASQSIEDAVILARCLKRERNDSAAALRVYVQTRHARTAAVQAGGRAGAANTLRQDYAYHNAAPPRDQDWIWRYDALTAPLSDEKEEGDVRA